MPVLIQPQQWTSDQQAQEAIGVLQEHLVFGPVGNSGTTIAAGAALNTGGAALSAASLDTNGQITLTPTGTPTTGVLCTVTFGGVPAFAVAPRSVNLTPGNATAGANAIQVYVSSITATTFVLSCVVAPTAASTLIYYYSVLG
jgi:hypothetical protein